MIGYVYILRAGDTNLFKIGHTLGNVKDRVKAIQTGCPYPLSIFRCDPTFFPAEMEKLFHRLLEWYRQKGEWFEVAPEIIADYFDSTPVPGRMIIDKDGLTGVVIRPQWHSTDERGPRLSANCVTPGELESECLELIRGLLHILAQARQDHQSNVVTYFWPEAWKQSQQ